MTDFTYIAEAQNGRVKIGCSRDPKARIHAALLYSPVPLRLVAMWQAARGEELELHRRFDALREYREWFRVEGQLVAFLESVWGRGVARIPEWSEFTFKAEGSPISRLRANRSAAAKARWCDPEWRAWALARKAKHREADLAAVRAS